MLTTTTEVTTRIMVAEHYNLNGIVLKIMMSITLIHKSKVGELTKSCDIMFPRSYCDAASTCRPPFPLTPTPTSPGRGLLHYTAITFKVPYLEMVIRHSVDFETSSDIKIL
ncbi:hypothetical protein EVAR_23298_1 [Eumeta japonica]|uniref:Uncharacterized protein n=1 Tax=Eumeta variegata TaxID=151549 RepID=A0A4C1V587_EUMVA|nr:hypothetical protein EVAR_23298_1 [Eumeta japonica]